MGKYLFTKLLVAFISLVVAGCSSSTLPGDDGGVDGTADAWPDGGADRGDLAVDGDVQGCVPTGDEVCDGVDNDCDGKIDEGACEACRCDYWGVSTVKAKLPRIYDLSPMRWRSFEVAFDGEGVLAFLVGGWLALRRLDGGVVGVDRQLAPAGTDASSVDVEWTGKRWLVVWRQADGDSMGAFIAALSPDGTTLLAGPAKIANGLPVALAAATDDDLYLVCNKDANSGGVFVLRFDGKLVQSGAPLPIPSMKDAYDASAVGGAVAITGSGEPETTKYLALVRGGVLVRETALMKIPTKYSPPQPGDSAVAADSNGIVTCGNLSNNVFCRYLSLADGTALGPPFLVSTGDSIGWDIERASCSMVLLGSISLGQGVKFVMYHFGADGEVDNRTIDRDWEGPNRDQRLFATSNGQLVRVSSASRTYDSSSSNTRTVLISTLVCRQPPPPVTDCDALNATACGFACGDLCSHPGVDCGILYGSGSGKGFPASQCRPVDCNVVDAPRCQERLAEPQECGSTEGTGYWLIPADCALPR